MRRVWRMFDFEEVGQDVVGDHLRSARLECSGPHRETAAERQADQCDLIDAKVIEHRTHRLAPLRRHRQAAVFERATLAGSVEGDHVIAGFAQEQESRCELLDAAVESAEEDHRALGARKPESVRRQPARVWTIGVGHGVALPKVSTVDGTKRRQESCARRLPIRIVGAPEELGRAPVEASSERATLQRSRFRQRHEVALPVGIERDARRCRPHLVKHGRLAHPAEPAVHLEVHADVGVESVEADGKRRVPCQWNDCRMRHSANRSSFFIGTG